MDRAVDSLAGDAADETQRFMAELPPSAGEAATAPILGPRLHTDLCKRAYAGEPGALRWNGRQA